MAPASDQGTADGDRSSPDRPAPEIELDQDLPKSVRTLLEALRTTFRNGSASSSQLLKATGLPERTYFSALQRARQWQLIGSNGRTNELTPAGRALFVAGEGL